MILNLVKSICIFYFSFLTVVAIHSNPNHKLTESDKIQFLLNELDKPNSNLRFIRNGIEYSGKEAKDHMQKKLDYAGNKIKTVEDFINQIATKSSITGNLYYILFPNGTKMESAKWLRETLKDIE
jgi:hypothetical protein